MPEVWFKDSDRYTDILTRERFPDHPPKFKIGDRVVFQHTLPGLEGRIAAVMDPRMALTYMGNQFDTHLHDWAAFCGRRKSELAEEHVYTIQFSSPQVVYPVSPSVPDSVKDSYRRWNKVTTEFDLEHYDKYWGQIAVDMHTDHRELPTYEEDIPQPLLTQPEVDIDGEGSIAVDEEDFDGQDEAPFEEGPSEPFLPEGPDGDGDEEREE